MSERIPPNGRALFIRFGGLGDILLATPSVRAVAQAFPGLTIDFLVGGGMRDALTGNPYIRHIYEFDKRGKDSRLDHFLPFLARLARVRYDLVINLHPSAKSLLMCWASGALTRLTFEKRMDVILETGRVAHAVDDFAKELKPLGIEAVSDRSLDFDVPEAAQHRVSDLLRQCGVEPSDRLLVINPAASRPLNRWPLERFGAVAAEFASRPGVRVVVTGAPPSFRTVMDGLDEVGLANELSEYDPGILNLAGRLSVKEFGALLQRAAVLLTCDTGPMHIAAALQTPLVVLSGAADPDRTGPLTSNSSVLIDRSLGCVPCRDRVCSRGDTLCMQNISVPAVIDALERRLLPASRGQVRFCFCPRGDSLLKLSARNMLKGRVKRVEHGAVNSEIIIELAGGDEVVSIITKDSAEDLQLALGKEVYAVIKSSDVMVMTDEI